MSAPLSGIRVIEVANYVAGPAVGALMADLGADVVKVEPPGGEVMRGVAPSGAGALPPINFLFELENRGKRSITIDLAHAEGPELLHALLAGADVFLTNLIAPRLERFGLMPAEVHALHPRLIYLSVTGYGITGPERGRLAFDFAAFWARSGIMSLVGHPGVPPVLSRIAQGDHTTGIDALAAVLAALRLRDQTGQGQTVEVALQQTGVYTVATDISRTLLDHKQPPKMDRERPDNPMFNTYETSDGEWIMLVHMTPDPYWPRLCAALEEPGWAADERWTTMRGRRAHGPDLAALIQDRIARHEMAHWRQAFDDNGLIWAPVSELPDVVDDPQLRHLGAFPAVAHPAGSFETVGVPFRIHDAAIAPRRRAPEVGEHTQEVLAELGWSEERIADVVASGVMG